MDHSANDVVGISCPVCGSSDRYPLVGARDVPIVACQFAFSREQALANPCGDIELVACADCGHVYNQAFVAEKLSYTSGYENTLGFSRHHRAHIEANVDRLIAQHDLRHKTVVEIGCGSADMLRYLCKAGGNRGIGYDPSQHSAAPEAVGAGSVEIIGMSFDDVTLGAKIDAVCSQHVLEHLARPIETLRKARELLVWGGLAYIEVPNADSIFRDMNIWDLTYEHVSYFSPASLYRALTDSGFSVLRLNSSFGGQYLDAEAEPAAAKERTHDSSVIAFDFLRTFSDRYGRAIDEWRGRLADWRRSSRKVVLWGAGAKAVTFLNILAPGATECIDYIIDINPRKANRFIPGTGQEIKQPAFLKSYRPDIVIVMNPEYVGEIETQIRRLSVRSELVTATALTA